MDTKRYQNDVNRSLSQSFHLNLVPESLLHGAIGIATEGGELLDAVKKALFYGKGLDRANLIEELGDLMWYIALSCNSLNIKIEDVLDINIAKLRKRYPEKFTEELAENRDLDSERKVLEQMPTEPATQEEVDELRRTHGDKFMDKLKQGE